jgi:hypothetical protein
MMIKSDAYHVWSNFSDNEYAWPSIKLNIITIIIRVLV